MSTALHLKRLVVFKSGERAYDEEFHSGVNIIRGSNGSGKSTIMDLLFFGLGGDLAEWKEYALLCDEVVLHISASGQDMTLRRQLLERTKLPMGIYFGPFEEAMKASSDGWALYPYARADTERFSFSQVLFDALGIPEVPGDEGSNITMHQMLRLMYVDQTTPFQRIFRLEPFDSVTIRSAVADLQLGSGAKELYTKRIQLRAIDRESADYEARRSYLVRAATALQAGLTPETMANEKADIPHRIDLLYQEIQDVENQASDVSSVSQAANKKRREVSSELELNRTEIMRSEQLQNSFGFEIRDSENFIEHLEYLLKEFDTSSNVYSLLGAVRFDHCPACLSELDEQDEQHCHLCGQKIANEEQEAKIAALQLDLTGQLTESTGIQRDRIEELTALDSRLRSLRRASTMLSRQLDELSVAPVDGIIATISEKSRQIGIHEARLSELGRFEDLHSDIMNLEEQLSDLSSRRTRLANEIEALELSQRNRRSAVLSKISISTRHFLELDLTEHQDFDHIDNFDFSFEDDWFAINGKRNVSTSASGMVVVKNSLFLGLLKTSLTDPDMIFPRFLMLDNVEDKGMNLERIQNFQSAVVTWSNNEEYEHQIIMTTANLNPILDSIDLTIGDSYTHEHRSLRIL